MNKVSHKALSCTPNTRMTNTRETVSIYNNNKLKFSNIRDANRGNFTKVTLNHEEAKKLHVEIPD